jgi:lipopolysaccharide/colanic/teichoic acid biosynthesis glycosyltransferase
MRRLLEPFLSGVALLACTPLLLVVGLAVRLDSRGPVFYRQERLGLEGRPFEIIKFRTMSASEGGGPAVTSLNDRRITRVGRVLRSTKLDELPQLLNVVRGEMSLVGPRPEVASYAVHWSEAHREIILSVRPGITDPASVAFRREAELLAAQADPEAYYISEVLPAKASLYVDYVQTRSLRRDLRILLDTVRTVVSS